MKNLILFSIFFFATFALMAAGETLLSSEGRATGFLHKVVIRKSGRNLIVDYSRVKGGEKANVNTKLNYYNLESIHVHLATRGIVVRMKMKNGKLMAVNKKDSQGFDFYLGLEEENKKKILKFLAWTKKWLKNVKIINNLE